MIPIDTLCESAKIRLIANALGLQQCTKTAACIIPIPGTQDVIAIGPREWIAKNVPGLGAMVEGAQPVAWITYGTIDGKKSLDIGSVASNLEYIKVHKEWRWQSLYLAATTQSSTAQAERAGWEAATKALMERATGFRRAFGGNCQESEEIMQCVAMLNDMKLAATSSTDAQAAAEVRDTWISVDERLPDEQQEVVVIGTNSFTGVRFAGKAIFRELEFIDPEDGGAWDASHWATLPVAWAIKRAGDTGEQADGGEDRADEDWFFSPNDD